MGRSVAVSGRCSCHTGLWVQCAPRTALWARQCGRNRNRFAPHRGRSAPHAPLYGRSALYAPLCGRSAPHAPLCGRSAPHSPHGQVGLAHVQYYYYVVQSKYLSSPCACLARDLAHDMHPTLPERRVFSSFDLSIDALVVTSALYLKHVTLYKFFNLHPINSGFGWGSTLYFLKVSFKLC
jgi:hypothetical protein